MKWLYQYPVHRTFWQYASNSIKTRNICLQNSCYFPAFIKHLLDIILIPKEEFTKSLLKSQIKRSVYSANS